MRSVCLIAMGLTIGACATSPTPPTPAEISTRHAEIAAAVGTISPREFALTGLYEVDVRCDAFFDAVAQGDHRSAAFRNGVSLLDGTTSGYMAATQRSAEDIAIAAVLFSGLDAQLANWRQYEFFGPMADSAKRLVRDARAAYRQQPLPTGRVEAVKYVHDYAQLCTFSTVLGYVNTALANARVTLEAPSTEIIGSANRAVVTSALAGSVDLVGRSDQEWARLLVFLEDAPTVEELRAQFAEDFPTLRSTLMAIDGSLTAAGQATLAQLGALRTRSAAFAQAVQALRDERARLQAEADNALRAQKIAADPANRTSHLTATADPVELPHLTPSGPGLIVIR